MNFTNLFNIFRSGDDAGYNKGNGCLWGLLVSVAGIALAHPALANPEGGTVSAGQASITTADRLVDVTQSSNRAVIDWRSFNISPDETTRFNQPDASAITLNRVNSNQQSVIEGQLKANGNIVIINPNGVFLTRSSRVDVGGLVATSADIDTQQFMTGSGNFNRPGKPDAVIRNDGQITARQAGLVGLVAPTVENNGRIEAKLGRVTLAAGDKTTVDFLGDDLIQVAVSDDVLQQLVSQNGEIIAEGGLIQLTAAQGRKLVDSLVSAGGTVSVSATSGEAGQILIGSAISSTEVKGRVQANGKRGGRVQVSGDTVRLTSTANISAQGLTAGGSVLVGGDYQGGNSLVPNAQTTIVEGGALVNVDALEQGNGGRAIFWADNQTRFAGTVSARGGAQGGDGGLVEVSGKKYLVFNGQVDTLAPLGLTGLLLLDPADIIIANGSGDSALDGTTTFKGTPSGAAGTVASTDTGPTTLYESELEGIAATTNLSLTSTNSITINNLSDGVLNFAQSGVRSVTLSTGVGGVVMQDTTDTLRTAGGALNIVTSGGGAATLGNLATNGGLITLNLAGASVVSGNITGTGTALTKSGTGVLTLGGTNTYTGVTTISAGALQISSASNLGAGTLLLAGGILQGSGPAITLANAVSLSTNSTVAGTSVLTFSGALTNVMAGNPTLTNNSTGLVTFSGAVNLSNSATSRTVTLAGTGNTTVSGVIANGSTSTAGALVKNGSGTLTLSGANTFAGGITLTAGTLAVDGASVLSTGALSLNGGTLQAASAARTISNSVTLSASSTLAGTQDMTFSGALSGANSLTLTNNSTGAVTFSNINISNSATNRTLTLSGTGNTVINGAVANGSTSTASALTKSGTGTVVLNGSNTYAGATTVSAGTLRATTAAALGAGTLALSGGTLQLAADSNINFGRNTTVSGSATITTDRLTTGAAVTHTLGTLSQGATTLTTASGSNISSGTAGLVFGSSTLTGNPTFTTGSGAKLTLGALTDGGVARSLTKNGAGLLYMGAAAASWATASDSVVVNNGTLQLGVSNAFGAGTNTAVTVNSTVAGATALFDLNGYNQSIGALTFGGTGGTATSISNVSTGAGTLTLGGNVTLTNTGNPLGSTLSGNLNLGGTTRTFTVNDSSSTLADLTVSAVISSAGGLTKSGSGTLVLSASNTYSGITTLSAGTLMATTAAALGAGTLTLSAGTLQLAADSNTNFGRNTTVSGGATVVIDRLTAGAAVTHTLGTLSQGSLTFTTASGSNISSGVAGLVFGNTTLTGNAIYSTGSGTKLTLGALTDGGVARGLTKTGAGTLYMAAAAASWATTSNALVINNGTLQLGANNAFGTGTNTGVTVNSTVAGATALLDLNGFNQSIGALTFGGTGGTATSISNVTTGAGTLTLGSNVTFTNTGNPLGSTLSGKLNLGATTRTFTIGDTSSAATDLTVDAVISGTGGLTKSGSGTLVLNGNNTYSGITTLSTGVLSVGHNNAAGVGSLMLNGGTLSAEAASRTLANTVSLAANSTIAGSNALTLSGVLTNTLAGSPVLTVNNSALTTFGAVNLSNSATSRTLTVSGTGNLSITGVVANGSTSTAGALTLNGSGILTLSGVNTYGGTTSISSGTLRWGASNVIPNASTLSVLAAGALDLAGYSDTFSALTNDGTMSFGSGGTLTTAGAQIYNGIVTGGNVNLVSSGGGAITATHASNNFTGTVSASTAGNLSLRDSNSLTLGTLTGNTVMVQAGGDLTVTGTLTGTATSGTPLTLVTGGSFINNAGGAALQTGVGGRWLVYSGDPRNDSLNGLTSTFHYYGCTYAGSCVTLPLTGNGILYTVTPQLTITPLAMAALTYGDAAPDLTSYSYIASGYLGTDAGTDVLAGVLGGSTTYIQGANAGTFDISYASGSLTSALGYSFSYANNSSAITVNKRPLTVVVQNQTINYGLATPTLDANNPAHYVWSNFYGADNPSALDSLVLSYGGTAPGQRSLPGTYVLGIASMTDANYDLASVATGSLLVDRGAAEDSLIQTVEREQQNRAIPLLNQSIPQEETAADYIALAENSALTGSGSQEPASSCQNNQNDKTQADCSR